MNTIHLTKQANEHFANKRFSEAKNIYSILSQKIGTSFYEFNIKQCEKLKNITETPPQKIQKSSNEQETEWLQLNVIEDEKLEIIAQTTYDNCQEKIKKAVLLIEIIDKYGNSINPDQKKFRATYSTALNSNFYYLNDSTQKIASITTITIPKNAKKLHLKALNFNTKNSEKISTTITIKRTTHTTPITEAALKQVTKTSINQNSVAIIADEFTFNSYKNEFTPVIIEPNNWRELLEEHKPEVFFCESAWSGVDSIKRPWKGQVYASTAFAKENRTQLLEIIKYCRKEGIATVFWNKEDPTHYGDKKHDFTKTANEFDYIFTSAEECVEEYKREYNRNHVYPLAFASNPRIFNPIETSTQRNKNIVFAGSWYENHIERCQEMEAMFTSLIKLGFSLEIYDRHFQSSDPLHIWPEHLRKFLHPSISHEQTAALYKSSDYGLNINTVKTSKTMFARRVFELITSNTICITNYSPGVELMFGDSVIYDKNISSLKDISEKDIQKMKSQALNLALSKHTYKHRWNELCQIIGKKHLENNTKITTGILVESLKEAEIALAWHQLNQKENQFNDLIIIASNKFPAENIGDLYQNYNKHDIQATALHYIKNYGTHSRPLIDPNQHALIFDIKTPPPTDQIQKAMNHTQYAEHHAIKLSNGTDINKYFIKNNNPLNTITPSSKLTETLTALANDKQIACIEV